MEIILRILLCCSFGVELQHLHLGMRLVFRVPTLLVAVLPCANFVFCLQHHVTSTPSALRKEFESMDQVTSSANAVGRRGGRRAGTGVPSCRLGELRTANFF